MMINQNLKIPEQSNSPSIPRTNQESMYFALRSYNEACMHYHHDRRRELETEYSESVMHDALDDVFELSAKTPEQVIETARLLAFEHSVDPLDPEQRITWHKPLPFTYLNALAEELASSIH